MTNNKETIGMLQARSFSSTDTLYNRREALYPVREAGGIVMGVADCKHKDYPYISIGSIMELICIVR